MDFPAEIAQLRNELARLRAELVLAKVEVIQAVEAMYSSASIFAIIVFSVICASLLAIAFAQSCRGCLKCCRPTKCMYDCRFHNPVF
jgi:hypothetical protein